MEFAIQLWSMAQDAAALQLLHFPSAPLIPCDASMKASFLAPARRCAVPKKTTDEVIAYLGTCRTDEIKVNHKFEPYTIPNTDLMIRKVFSILDMSPTNSLATYGNPAFPTYRHHGLTRGPTVLETIIEYTTKLSVQSVLDIFAQKLAESLVSVRGDAVSGGGAGYAGGNVGLRLAPWPKAYPMLDEKWDNIYPIMIGPLPRCAALARALGDVAELIEVRGSGPPLGVVRILEKGWEDVEVQLPNGVSLPISRLKYDTLGPIAQPWLVPLDETTLHDSLPYPGKKGR